MIWKAEHTDTFGGQANYCWVHRHTINVPDGARQRQIVRAAKAACGLTGHRAEVCSLGDVYEIRPRGLCQVIFVWEDDHA